MRLIEMEPLMMNFVVGILVGLMIFWDAPTWGWLAVILVTILGNILGWMVTR